MTLRDERRNNSQKKKELTKYKCSLSMIFYLTSTIPNTVLHSLTFSLLIFLLYL